MDGKVYSRLPSMGKEYNTSKQGESSFRVLYYGTAAGSVPFLWESQPGTPKDKFSDGPLPPLTPPPRYQSSPLASPSLRKKHSKFFNSSIFATKKISASGSPPSSSSSFSSSSYSLPSTPFHGNSETRSRSIVGFRMDEDQCETVTGSPTSTLCFGPRNGCSYGRSNVVIKSVKKVVRSIVGRRISNY